MSKPRKMSNLPDLTSSPIRLGASEPSEPERLSAQNELRLRRFEKFFGAKGLCARYGKIGDDLIQFHEIAQWLVSAVPGLTYNTATARFVLAAKHGALGSRDYGPRRRAVASLIDLDGMEFAASQYPLRPSSLRVEMRPALMRARRSTWAAWLQNERWPVPAWLRSTLIEGVAVKEADAASQKQKSGQKFQRAQAALKDHYQGDVPGSAEKTNAELIKDLFDDKLIVEKYDLKSMASDTILRAAGRK
jgi:hypothetical protein